VALPSEASGVKLLEEALTIVAVDDQDGDDIEVHDTSGVIFGFVLVQCGSARLARAWQDLGGLCM